MKLLPSPKCPVFRAALAALALAAAIPGQTDAAVVTSGLIYNFDANSGGAAAATWTSVTPGANTTRQWNTSGAGIALISSPDPGPSIAINRGYHMDGVPMTTSNFTELGVNSTIELWIKPDGLAGDRQVVWENGGLGSGMAVLLHDNVLYFTAKTGGNIAAQPQVALTAFLNEKDMSNFIHVVVTCNTTTGFKLYVNPMGEFDPQFPKAVHGTYINASYSGTDLSAIGGTGGSTGSLSNTGSSIWNVGLYKPFAGTVGIVRVYNRTLSDAEVRQNYVTVTLRDPAGGTPITRWAEWGVSMSRGGFSSFANEGMRSPQPGDIENSGGFDVRMVEWRDVTLPTNGLANFLDGTRFPRAYEQTLGPADDGYINYGMAQYLHTYVKASDTTTVNVAFDVDSATPLYLLWLNGNRIAPGQVVTLNRGWNRLMVRSSSPANNFYWYGWPRMLTWSTGWNIRLQVTRQGGGAVPGIVFQTNDPARKVLVTNETTKRNFRYLSEFRRWTDYDQPVFARGEFCVLNYNVRVGLGTDPHYKTPNIRLSRLQNLTSVYSFDPARVAANNPNVGQAWTLVPAASFNAYAPANVHVIIHRSGGAEIYNRILPLTYGAVANGEVRSNPVKVDLGVLSADYYRVTCNLLDANGQVQARDREHAFSVTTGPVSRVGDAPGIIPTVTGNSSRILSVVGHWLLTPGQASVASKFRWLKRVGITRQQKLYEGWITSKWNVSLAVDANNVATGPVTVNPSADIDFALQQASLNGVDVVGDLVEGISSGGNLGVPGAAQAPQPQLPPFASPAWDAVYYNYGRQVVMRYKNRIKVWGGINEIDLRIPNTTAAADHHIRAGIKIRDGMLSADANARYVSSSLAGGGNAVGGTTAKLIAQGFFNTPHFVDVHGHPFISSYLGDATLSRDDPRRGRALMGSTTKPCWYGETSATGMFNYDGAYGEAGDLIKQMAWAINLRGVSDRPVVNLSYLVAYDAPDYWSYNHGFGYQNGDPGPVVNSANTVSRWLDGRPTLPALGLPQGVSNIRVTSTDTAYPENLAVWCGGNSYENGIGATRTISIPVQAGTNVKLVFWTGGEITVPVSGGIARITIGTIPVIVRGNFP
jgi:hypothetical protein